MAKITRRQFLRGVVIGGTAMTGAMKAPGLLKKAYAGHSGVRPVCTA